MGRKTEQERAKARKARKEEDPLPGQVLLVFTSQAPAGCCLKFTVCQLLRATFLLRCFYFYTASHHLSSLYWTETEKSHWKRCNKSLHFSFLVNIMKDE